MIKGTAHERGDRRAVPAGYMKMMASGWKWLCSKAVPWDLRWWEAALMRLFFCACYFFRDLPAPEREVCLPASAEWIG